MKLANMLHRECGFLTEDDQLPNWQPVFCHDVVSLCRRMLGSGLYRKSAEEQMSKQVVAASRLESNRRWPARSVNPRSDG